ncbi:centromere protein T [Tachysurus vachellii]|uniref:centromere protein T n=1 Tax=Tachysurus vachellii TaxID=175792 RepID=UPI00296A9834|nr:centromere protein T [Tachysurus vachellii]
MDSVEEDEVSARVLLRNVLHTETQRSPVTRSKSHDQQLSRARRSSRLRNTPETPHVALRHKLKQKLHETAAQSPLPPSKRARSEGKTLRTPAVLPSPALYDDDVTPRGLLRGIIQTESEASLLLSGQTAVPEAVQHIDEASIHSNRRSDGMSGLELPDLATEPLTHMIQGLSRRRPPPTFNVSVFEKQLDQPSGEEEMEVSQENSDVTKEQDLSAGSKSVLSLTLKTPFVSLQSERGGLKRKAAGRRKQLSVDAFDEAVQKRLERQNDQDYTVVQDGRTLQDSAWQKFTLGLSNVTVPELTTDMMMSNTELYAHPQTAESESRDTDGGVTKNEMKRDDGGVGEELQESAQDQEKMRESNISKPQPDPSEHPEPDSQCQEEEDEVDMFPPSQEKESTSLSPEDIPFAPTQAMGECVSQPRVQEQEESLIPEAQLEEMYQREDESFQGEQSSHLPQQITRRVYRSEGGALRPGVMARVRGTKSLGMDQDPTEKQLQNFTTGTVPKELASVADEPNRSLASPSAVDTTKPSSSETQQDSLVQNIDVEFIQDLDQVESEEVVVSVHVSPTVDFEEVEEEQQQEEEVEEEQQQEEEVEEEQEEEVEEEQQQEEEMEEDQQQEEFEEQEEELLQHEEEDAQSEELSMQTPSFIRQRKQVSTPGALATPAILRALNAGPASKVVKPRQKRQPRSSAAAGVLPKSYVMSVFKHFAKTKVAGDVYPVISDILKRYFDRMADDLEVYSAHAKRKTIEVEDVELLMRRQGFVTDSTPVNVLIEKFLPLEYRKLLIPVATSGNKVVPDRRR